MKDKIYAIFEKCFIKNLEVPHLKMIAFLALADKVQFRQFKSVSLDIAGKI